MIHGFRSRRPSTISVRTLLRQHLGSTTSSARSKISVRTYCTSNMPTNDAKDPASKIAHFQDGSSIEELLRRNEAWANKTAEEYPAFFPTLANKQQPKLLWIGCSDSRVPETTILDLLPGEIFVLRNIANVIANGDMSMLSCVQFAVEVLQVQHIVVCGHYGCGGVQAALTDKKLGLIDNWLRYVRDVRADYDDELAAIKDMTARAARLVECNVLVQTRKVERITYVSNAMDQRGLQVHALVYDVATGKLRQLQKLPDKKRACYTQAELDLAAH